jgi:2-polyprenyl-3-methyl-5-hydroxy-6-metoxy-1,4-benzoquinol methylase
MTIKDQNEYLKPESIRTLANSFQQSRILLTAVELDVFTILDRHMLTAGQVAQQISADERATERLLNALVALGFLNKIHEKFYNSENAAQYLARGKQDFMGGLFHSIGLWNTWSSLTESVKAGTSVAERRRSSTGIDWSEAFIGAMHYRGEKEAKIIAMMLDISEVKGMLDVGGGSGAFSMAFVKQNPSITASVFDLPNILPITKKYIEKETMTESIRLIGGDMLKDDFNGTYDLILLSAIVHMHSYDDNMRLIKKCFDALNPKGQIIIKDWIMDENRTEPAAGAFFALNMLVGTAHGDTYTEAEMKEWMNFAGIHNITRKDTSFGSSLLIGKKE